MNTREKQISTFATGKYMIAKLFDFGATLPLVVLYSLGIFEAVPNILLKARHLAPFDVADVATFMSQIGAFIFMALMIVLFALRRLPVSRAKGARPLLAALVGSNLPLAFLALPHAPPNATLSTISNILISVGLAASILITAFLGRSFGILPQARKLVIIGPYRIIRHPLYVAEQITIFGIMLQFTQPWSTVVAIGCLAAQFPRMYYEEEILTHTWSAYKAYKERTARIIPGVY